MRRKLSVPQSQFFQSEAKYVAAVAGFGSGKTEVALTRMISNMMQDPTIDQAYLAPTYPLIRDIWYPKVEEFFEGMGLGYNINKSEHKIYVEGMGKIICRTMEKPERIIGWEAKDAFLDEFDVLPTDKAEHVLRKISARLRQKGATARKNQLFVTTTPEGFKATYKFFKKEPLPDSHLIQMSTYSNEANLPDDYIQTLRDQYPDQLIEAYLNGEFVNLQSGTVYYAYDRFKHDTKYVPRPREALHIGMDFNVNDMCAGVFIKRDGVLHGVDEFFGLRDTPDMCDAIKEKYSENHVTVYPDASGKGTTSKSASESDVSILKGSKFIVVAPNKNPLIKNRVSSVNNRFERGGMKINVDRCPEMALAFEQQPYDKKTGQPEKDGYLDNRVDGTGYMIHSLFPIVHRKVQQQSLGGF